MSFDGEVVGGEKEPVASGEVVTQKSLEEITPVFEEAEHKVTDVQAAEKTAKAAEPRAKYEAYIVEKIYLDYPEFKPDLAEGPHMQAAVNALITLQEEEEEYEPSIDVLKDFSTKDLVQVISAEMKTITNENFDELMLLDRVYDDIKGKQGGTKMEQYQELLEVLTDNADLKTRMTEIAKNKDNINFDGEISPEDNPVLRRRIEHLKAITQVAAVSPAYATVLEAANINLDDRDSVVNVIQSTGFFEDESVDEATKNEVRASLGMAEVYPNEAGNTGQSAQNALRRGAGMTDDGERIPYSKENPLVEKGVRMYPRNALEKTVIIEIDFRDGETRRMEVASDTDTNHLGDVIRTYKLKKTFEDNGWSGLLGEGISDELSDLRQDEINLADRIYASIGTDFTASSGEMGGEGVDQALNNFDKKYAQWFRVRGDAAKGDFDPVQARADFKQLGMPNGINNENFDVFDTAMQYVKTETEGGTPNFFALHSHLASKPELKDKVPALTPENQKLSGKAKTPEEVGASND